MALPRRAIIWPKEKQPAPSRKIRVDRLRLEGGRISADTSAVGGGDVRELSLPGIELREIGAPDGTSAGRIAQAVVTALVQQAVGEAAKAELEGLAGELLREQLGEKSGRALEGLGRDLLGGKDADAD